MTSTIVYRPIVESLEVEASLFELIYSNREINWRYWDRLPKLSAEEACKLMCALDPNVYKTLDTQLENYSVDNSRPISTAGDMLRLAERQGKDFATIAEWMQWAKDNGFGSIPYVGFRLAVKRASQLATVGATRRARNLSHEITPAMRRKELDLTQERGCRRRILELWEEIENLHGPNANAHQVLRRIEHHRSSFDMLPKLKTVQNHLSNLKKEGLIP